jgi:hypothetical protein
VSLGGKGSQTTIARERAMSDREHLAPGPRAGEKAGETSEPGHAQPQAAEVESARLLANQARDRVDPEWSDDDLRRLADEYVALDLGEDLDAFVEWVRRQPRAS